MQIYLIDSLDALEDPRLVDDEKESEFILTHWDGYIDPYGDFYTTKMTGALWNDGCGNIHEAFAEARLHGKQGSWYSFKDRLVGEFGWVSLTFWSLAFGDSLEGISMPKQITVAQESALFAVFAARDFDGSVCERFLEDHRTGTIPGRLDPTQRFPGWRKSAAPIRFST